MNRNNNFIPHNNFPMNNQTYFGNYNKNPQTIIRPSFSQ
jgi:hypothetical protein